MGNKRKRPEGGPFPELPPTEALIREAMAAAMAGHEWAELHAPGQALLARWLSGSLSPIVAARAVPAAATTSGISGRTTQGAQLVCGKRGDSWRARYSFRGKTRTVTGLASEAEAAAVRDAAFLLLHPLGNFGGDTASGGGGVALGSDSTGLPAAALGTAPPGTALPAAVVTALNSACNPFAPRFPLRLADFLAAVLKSCQGDTRQRHRTPAAIHAPAADTAPSSHSPAAAWSFAGVRTCRLTAPAAAALAAPARHFAMPTAIAAAPAAPQAAPPAAGCGRGPERPRNLVAAGRVPPRKRPQHYEAGATYRDWLALPDPAADAPLHAFRTRGLGEACRDLGLPHRPAQVTLLPRRWF